MLWLILYHEHIEYWHNLEVQTGSQASTCSRNFTTYKFGAWISKRLHSSAIVVRSNISICHLAYAGGPGTIQILMDRVLLGIKDNFCMASLDDILIYSRTFEEHPIHI